jgi:hypothetical protein
MLSRGRLCDLRILIVLEGKPKSNKGEHSQRQNTKGLHHLVTSLTRAGGWRTHAMHDVLRWRLSRHPRMAYLQHHELLVAGRIPEPDCVVS